MTAPWWWRKDDGVVITVQVQPRASRDHVAGIHDGALKVCLTAAPVDGKANDRLLRFLAGALGVRPAQVTLLRGGTARRKTVAVHVPGLDPGVLLRGIEL